MLDPYPFKSTGKKKSGNIPTLTYSFRDWKDRKFIVEVECYRYNLHAIKFYPHSYSESDNKYRVLTKFGQPGRLIGTCIALIGEIYRNNPTASFGFIGINSLSEQKANTKRFRVYSQAISSKISPINFSHKNYPDQSLYILVNRKEIDKDPDFVRRIEEVIEPIISDYFKNEEIEEKRPNTRKRRM